TVRAPLPTDPVGLPPLPLAYHATLADGLAELGVRLDPAQLGTMDAFVRLLLAWTAAINLTAIREPVAVAREHMLDSLSVVPLLAGMANARILDLGTGGGLPGIPLAIALPKARVLLVESIGKKAMFLRAAVEALGLQDRVDVATARAEDVARGSDRGTVDVVTVRAVGSIPESIV